MTRGSIGGFLLGAMAVVVVYEAAGFRFVDRPVPQAAVGAAVGGAVGSDAPSRGVGPHAAAVVVSRRGDAAPDPAEIARLRAAAADAKLRAELAEQQLEAVEGRAAEWPADVASQFKKESVEKQLKEFVIDRGLGKIKSLDCAEYPCVGFLELTDSSLDASKSLHAALSEMVRRDYKGQVLLSITNSRSEGGSNAVNLAAVSVVPNDDELKSRVRHRTKVGLEENGSN